MVCNVDVLMVRCEIHMREVEEEKEKRGQTKERRKVVVGCFMYSLV